LINAATYDALDELRRLHHLFRHAYALELDAERLQIVLRKAMKLRDGYLSQFEHFDVFLQSLIE
jgi:hypothetical protein